MKQSLRIQEKNLRASEVCVEVDHACDSIIAVICHAGHRCVNDRFYVILLAQAQIHSHTLISSIIKILVPQLYILNYLLSF
jgi:hypothetical protein